MRRLAHRPRGVGSVLTSLDIRVVPIDGIPVSHDAVVRKLNRPIPDVAAVVQERWPAVEIVIEKPRQGVVRILGLEWATWSHDRGRMLLSGRGAAGPTLAWLAWAISSVVPGASAFDPQDGQVIASEPQPFAEIEALTRRIQAEQVALSTATEPYAGPEPEGASEGQLVLAWLLANGLIEGGPFSRELEERITKVVIDGRQIGERIERLLLDDDTVAELFAGADDLSRMVRSGVWVPPR